MSVGAERSAETAVAIGPAVADEALELYRIMRAAQLAEQASGARPPANADEAFEAAWIAYLIRSGRVSDGPATCWVAQAGLRPVGFACGARRGPIFWLALLYVAPDWQRQGIGRQLLERTYRPAGTGPGQHAAPVVATLVDAASPGTQQLYWQHGMRPDLSIVMLQGALPVNDIRKSLAPEDCWDTLRDEVAQLDLAVLGYPRNDDHERYWNKAGFRFRLFRDEAGAARGYGYWNPFGRLGPLVGYEAERLPELIGACLEAMAEDGHRRASVLVPEANPAAVEWLTSRGFTPAGREIVYATGPTLDWRRCREGPLGRLPA